MADQRLADFLRKKFLEYKKYLICWRNCWVVFWLFIKVGEQYQIEIDNTKCCNYNKQQIDTHYFEEGGRKGWIPRIEAALI